MGSSDGLEGLLARRQRQLWALHGALVLALLWDIPQFGQRRGLRGWADALRTGAQLARQHKPRQGASAGVPIEEEIWRRSQLGRLVRAGRHTGVDQLRRTAVEDVLWAH